jgi:hypothetical protein
MFADSGQPWLINKDQHDLNSLLLQINLHEIL